MKKYIKYIFTLIMATGFYTCNDYLDVNTPSEAIPVEDLTMKDLLGPTLFNTVYAYYYSESTNCNYAQYYAGYGYSEIEEAFN
ncbi:MAG: hypothetical protein ACK5MZ_06210, partial [Aestuariibaculum sp.]